MMEDHNDGGAYHRSNEGEVPEAVAHANQGTEDPFDKPTEQSDEVVEAPPTPLNKLAVVDMTSNIVVIFFASLVELIAAGTLCREAKTGPASNCEEHYGWAVAVGSISLIVSFFMLLAIQFKPNLATRAAPAASLLLFSIWVSGIAIVTFDKPFNVTGNGYFGSWIAGVASFVFVYNQVAHLRNIVGRVYTKVKSKGNVDKLLIFMCLMSITEFLEAFFHCTETKNCKTVNGFALSAGIISAVVCLGAIFSPQMSAPMIKKVSLFLFVWWIIAACFITFEGPFLVTGNGYFSSWAAFFASVYLVSTVFKNEIDDVRQGRVSFTAARSLLSNDFERPSSPTTAAVTQDGNMV